MSNAPVARYYSSEIGSSAQRTANAEVAYSDRLSGH